MITTPRSSVALAFVLFLCGLSVAMGVAGGESAVDGQITITSDENTTNYLSPTTPSISDEEYQQVSMDVSSAATVAAQEIHSEHDSRTFEHRLQSTDGAVAQEQLETIHDRFESLDQRQQELLNRYSNGDISGETFLRELVTVQILIDAQSDLLDRTTPQADPSDDFRVEIESLQDTVSVQQPVTDRVQESLVGTDDPTTVYVQAGTDSLVFALIDDQTQIRQATLLSERDLAGEDQFGDDFSPGGYSEAQKRMEALYPWAYSLPNLDIGGDGLSVYSKIYQLGLSHPHGELTAYFDGATTNVFHETQRLSVHNIPTETTRLPTDQGTVTVETTRETGPMKLAVETDDGVATDATVTINEQVVGSTNDDGVLWTVQPRESFDITVTTADGQQLTASLDES